MKVEDRLSLAGILSARAHASGSSRGEAPEPEHVVAAEPSENLEAEPKVSTTLSSLFPAIAEGWALLASHLAEYGSGVQRG